MSDDDDDVIVEVITYWGKWRCKRCDIVISAEPPPGERQPICPSCHSPRMEDDPIFDDSELDEDGAVINPNIADTPEELAIALGGEDWTCEHCSATNRNREEVCFSCHAPRGEKKHDVPPVKVQPQIQPPQISPPSSDHPLNDVLKMILLSGGIGFIMVAVIGFLVWGFSSHLVPGQVTSTNWAHYVDKETFTPATGQNWQENIFPSPTVFPINGHGEHIGIEIQSCQVLPHGFDHHLIGSHVSCSAADNDHGSLGIGILFGASRPTVSRVSNANGSYTQTTTRPKPAPIPAPAPRSSYSAPSSNTRSSPSRSNSLRSYSSSPAPTPRPKPQPVCTTVNDYQDIQLYDNWCNYLTYEWKFNDSYQTSGVNANSADDLTWPKPSIGDLDRLSYSEKYRVDVSFKGGTTYKIPRTQEDYLTWKPGQTVQVRVTNFGYVSDVIQ